MSSRAVVGCGVGCVVGAEALSETAGVWVKTRFYRDGNFLCATVYSVAAGEPKIVELRVDVRPIARAVMRAHLELHQKSADKASLRGKPLVGWSLGKMWKGVKKTAKAIGRTKLVKGVVAVTKTVAKAAKTVAKSKAFGAVLGVAAVFPLTAPFAAPALGAYAAANAAVKGVEVGAKVLETAKSVASTIRTGKRLASSVKSAKAKTSAAIRTASASMTSAQRRSLAARAQAAGKLTLNAKGKSTVAASLAKAPAGAARQQVARTLATRLKSLAEVRKRTVLAKNLPAAASSAVVAATRLEMNAAPVIAKAAAAAKKIADPTVQAKLVAMTKQGAKAKAVLEGVQKAAASGNLDAQKNAAIINLVARNRARIQGASQANAGGLPGVLITRDGRLVKGRFRVQANAAANGVLYRGPGKRDTGSFATVSGVQGCYAINGSTVESANERRPAINGDLPLDGVRLAGRGANSYDIGPYEVEGSLIGCGDTPCAPCAARAS